MKGFRFLALSVFLFACLALAFRDATLAAQETWPPPSAGEPDNLNIERLGQIGGEGTTIVAVQGHFAFTNLGSRLITLNISDPTHPLVVGQSEPFLTGTLSSFILTNNIAYATAGNHFWVIDLTDPTQPEPVGSYPTPGTAQQVTTAGHYAYVANGVPGNTGLQIFDISYPLLPVEVGFHETPQGVLNVTVVGNYAYLGLGWCGYDYCSPGAFQSVDISDPANPTTVSVHNLPASPTGVVVDNHRAYVMVEARLCDEYLCYDYGELRVMDVTYPAAPTQIGVLAPIWGPGKLTIIGDNAYIPSFGLLVLDISDPTDIVTVGMHGVPGIARDVALVDGMALLAADWTGIWLLDVSNPAAIARVGHYDAPTYPITIEVVNDYAYLTGLDGFHILDVADPYNPHPLSALSSFGEHSYHIAPLAVSGDYAYLAGEVLMVTNISDPTTPFLVTTHDDPSIDAYNDVMVIDQYAYLIGYRNSYDAQTWLEIVDISTPSTPTPQTSYPLPYWSNNIDIAGNYAYISSLDGLQIINISDPSNPILTGVFSLEELYANGRKVVVAGHYVYLLGIVNTESKLWIIDVSDPGNPILTSSYAFPYDGWYTSPLDLELVGHHLYISNATRLNILDVSEITAPVEVGVLFDGYNVGFQEIAVIGKTIYSTGGAAGLINLRFTADSHTVTANSGATLVYTDTQGTNATVAIAPGTVNVTTTLVYSQLPTSFIQPGKTLAGHAFDVVAYQGDSQLPELNFLQPITVTIHYTDAAIGVITEEAALELQWQNEGTWLPAASTCDPPSTIYHDPANNLIQVPICRTGRFAIFGPTNQTFLPFLP